MDADHFLDQVGGAVDVGTPAGRGDAPFLALRAVERDDREAQALEDAALRIGLHRHAAEPPGQRGIVMDQLAARRRRACAHHLRSLAAAQAQDEIGEDIEAGFEELRIDAALEPAARVRGEVQRPPGGGDALRIEIGDLQQHVGRRLGAARMLAAHDPGDVVDARVVGDHRHRVVEQVVLAVERGHALTVARAAGDDRALELRQVVGVRRAAEGEHHIIGNVDQCRDRPLSGALEPRLQPLGRRAVPHAANDAAVERRAAFGVIGADLGRARERARHRLGRERLEGAQPRRGEIARDAIDAHAIGAVGRDRHVEHRIGAVIIGEGRAHRRIRRQFDDALVVVAQLELACRAHHAVRFDAAHRRLAQRHAARRHHRARQPKHPDEACARVGRAANHLERRTPVHFGPGVDREHLQLVGIGMPRGGEHARDAKARERGGGILDPFDFEPDGVELGRDCFDRGFGLKEVLEPGEREFHVPALLSPKAVWRADAARQGRDVERGETVVR